MSKLRVLEAFHGVKGKKYASSFKISPKSCGRSAQDVSYPQSIKAPKICQVR